MSRDLTDTIIAAVSTGTGKQVGDGTAPATPVLPYSVLYPLPSPTHSGDLFSPDRDRGWVYQFTTVGATREQAQWLADQIQTTVEGSTFGATDVTVMGVETVSRGAVERDDDATQVTGPGDTASLLFYSVDTYEFWTTR